jgi:hypothetical protein
MGGPARGWTELSSGYEDVSIPAGSHGLIMNVKVNKEK